MVVCCALWFVVQCSLCVVYCSLLFVVSVLLFAMCCRCVCLFVGNRWLLGVACVC